MIVPENGIRSHAHNHPPYPVNESDASESRSSPAAMARIDITPLTGQLCGSGTLNTLAGCHQGMRHCADGSGGDPRHRPDLAKRTTDGRLGRLWAKRALEGRFGEVKQVRSRRETLAAFEHKLHCDCRSSPVLDL